MSTCVVSIYTLGLNTGNSALGKQRHGDRHKFKVDVVHGGVPGQPIQPSEALSQKIKN